MNGHTTTRTISLARFRYWRALVAIVVLAICSTAIAQGPDDRPRRRGGPRDGRMFNDDWRGPGHWRDRFDRDEAPLPPEVVEKMLSIVKERFPDRFERLMRLRERDPERCERFLRRKLAPIIGEYMQLREDNPDLAEGMIAEFRGQERLHALVDEYQDIEDAERRAAIETEMEEIVREQFSLIGKRMAFRLQQFERRLEDQQRRLERYRQRFEEERAKLDEHVARRMEELKSGKVRPPGPRFGRGAPPDDDFAAPPPGPRRFGDGDGPRLRDGKGRRFRDGDCRGHGKSDRRRFRDGRGGRRGDRRPFDWPEDDDRRPPKDDDQDDDEGEAPSR